ncbi:MAG TPA: helicase HerA-like domain-containing protein [Ilumatobacteraceae bacterium]|nr:helicase HerA-like domain-containing protein [Ilumatobacteraceae bacterium]
MAELFFGGTVDPATHERTGVDVRIGTDTLTTHGVIVGMTGSGKTGLGVVLIEEVLRAGLPALLIDPKGDLTNLCLTFPELRPADFRPWIDDAQAKAAGISPDEFAAQQSKLWTEGLAGWGIGPADIAALRAATDFTIYTPGSQSGVPINIVGSLQVPGDMSDAEVVGDEIEGYVSGLLGLVGIAADPLASREHILLSNLIAHSWNDGQALDLPTLVGMIARPPIRKLGVFELDQFFPPDDRMALAMRLNGLLASPSFAAWGMGSALDIQSLLYTADGKARCAIVTTAHLSDEERQFVTSLVLSKLVTWMRRQSGTTDLRTLVYMDEVAGYLPPTANPPTKKPIMLLMKQARAFGVGVVLTTQNPVDVDYKALSNAGTWMIGRLQTDRDKQRLLDGMSTASGGVDVAEVGDTISGLAKREFVLRRAGTDHPEVFTTRWAMSYLRGPLTRDQIGELTTGVLGTSVEAAVLDPSVEAADATDGRTGGSILNDAVRAPATSATSVTVPDFFGSDSDSPDSSPVMPEVADGVAVRWVDVAAPWVSDIGGDPRGTVLAPAVVARVSLRYDDTKADLLHDSEYEAVIFPLDESVDASRAIAVDHDDRDLRTEAPANAVYRLVDAPIATKSYFSGVERGLVDHLTRSLVLELPTNQGLKLYARPGESNDAFAVRCAQLADERADAEIAKLRDKYEKKATTLRRQIETAEDRADVLAEEATGKRNSELLSTAGSILGGLLGGRRSRGGLLGSVLGKAGTAAGRRGRSRASEERVEAAANKVAGLVADLADVEAELAAELTEIDARWMALANDITSTSVALERTDVKVTTLVVAWVPVR